MVRCHGIDQGHVAEHPALQSGRGAGFQGDAQRQVGQALGHESRRDQAAQAVAEQYERALRVLAALLAYPDQEMRGYLDDMLAILRSEHALSAERLQEIDALIDALQVEIEARDQALYAMVNGNA